MNFFRGKRATEILNTVIKTVSIFTAVFCIAVFSGCGVFGAEDKVTVSQTSATVRVGGSVILTATSSEGRAVSWISSNEDVATVDGGIVTGISEGNASVTASDGKKMATCEITVIPDDTKKEGYTLVWSDEFEGDSLDLSKWGYQTGTRDTYGEGGPANWGNNELQYYTENNVTVSDGSLTITAKRENKENKNFTSARITTRGKFYQTYGFFEARIKLPAGKGMWPAFWMLPQPTDESSSHNAYGGWAANGELDIMEAQGLKPDRVCGTIHYGGYYPDNKYSSKEYTFTQSDFTEWHTYAVEWTERYIKWFVDGVPYSIFTNEIYYSVASDSESAPYDQPFYILLNLAVDSGKFDPDSRGGPEEDFVQAEMCVDYVRVYEIEN